MSKLEEDLCLPNFSNQNGSVTHSVPFGAHSFIENKGINKVYYESQLHSDASYIPLLQRSEPGGGSLTIKHLDKIQSMTDEPYGRNYADQVERTRRRYKKWDHHQEKNRHVMRSFQDAVEACYEWESPQLSQRVSKAQYVSLGVASDLISETVKDLKNDTKYLKDQQNPLYETTSSLAQHYRGLAGAIQKLHGYVQGEVTRNAAGAADDPHSESKPTDRRGQLVVWYTHIRPASPQLLKLADEKARRLDDDMDYKM